VRPSGLKMLGSRSALRVTKGKEWRGRIYFEYLQWHCRVFPCRRFAIMTHDVPSAGDINSLILHFRKPRY
jgi:hypothetical protein